MSDSGFSLGKLILIILLLILTGVALYETNLYLGQYLNTPLWLGIVAGFGIFDIAVYYAITRPRR
jgi:hypothetical protein